MPYVNGSNGNVREVETQTVKVKRSFPPKVSAFEVDDRIVVKLKPELAFELGELILGSETGNTAFLALGHQLKSVLPEEDEN